MSIFMKFYFREIYYSSSNWENDFHVNQKRINRLMRILGLKSVCHRKRKNYIKSTPQVTAGNVLNREFTAENFGEK